jgi:hypothetical protein
MSPKFPFTWFVASILLMFSSKSAAAVAAEPVRMDVHFALTDLDYKPIPTADVRVVLGAKGPWQRADAGHRFTTDAAGASRFTDMVALTPVTRKRPTNFVDSLFSRAQPADFLQVAAELGFAGHRWLYVVHLYRFADGDVLLDHVEIYSRDQSGNFTVKAEASEQGWKIADLGGLVLTTPGHEVWRQSFGPDENDPEKKHWTLDLAFRRFPEPVRR